VGAYFTIRELTHIALIAVLMYIVGALAAMSAVAVTSIIGIKVIAAAFLTSIILALGCMWIRKVGVMSFICLLYGLMCGLIMPAIPHHLVSILSGGIVADLSVAIFRTDYSSEKATTLATGVRAGISSVVGMFIVLIFGTISLRGATLIFETLGALIHIKILISILSLGGIPGSTLNLLGSFLTLGVLGAFMPNIGVAPWIVDFSRYLLGSVGFSVAGLEVILEPTLILGVSAVGVALGTVGGYIGVRIARELKVAGVYK